MAISLCPLLPHHYDPFKLVPSAGLENVPEIKTADPFPTARLEKLLVSYRGIIAQY